MFSISKAKYASYMGPTLKLQEEGGGGGGANRPQVYWLYNTPQNQD